MNLAEIIAEMEKEADALEGDTLVSMAEGVCNSRIARELRRWASLLKFAEL